MEQLFAGGRMNKEQSLDLITFSAIALIVFSGFAIAQAPGKKATSAFTADLSGNTVAEGFIVAKDNAWNTKDRIYTGTFKSDQIGSGTFYMLEDSKLAFKDGEENPDGRSKAQVTIYLTSTDLGLKKIYMKSNGSLNYDSANQGSLLLKGSFEITGGVDSSGNQVKIIGKGTYSGSGSNGNFNLHITGLYKIVP